MATKRMNVLVYSGDGSSRESVQHCLYSLQRLLSPTYAVRQVNGEAIIKEPWTPSCALLVFPGGADLGYCSTLNGEGNRRIIEYVGHGGRYLGFCAGGYYGSRKCEFEVGSKQMEVIGNRELAFYPGICRGSAFPGYVYHSEKGAKAAEVVVSKDALSKGSIPAVFRAYYNGGGIFVDAPKFHDEGVEILASYTEDIAVDAGMGKAAVVYCKVDEGAAILTSNHPEFAAVNIDKDAGVPGFDKIVDALAKDDQPRTDFLKACLWKFGLEVNQEQNVVPPLSRLHLSSIAPSNIKELATTLSEIIATNDDGQEYIEDENDKFCIERSSTWSFRSVADAVPTPETDSISDTTKEEADQDRILDYSRITKHILIHDEDIPQSKETPYFNHEAFYTDLMKYQSGSAEVFGKHLLYGEVVTSTNTILEKNTRILRRLPNGFTATATIQVAGRGRGSNVWVSPAGSLMFSTVVRHPIKLVARAPVVFLQYLIAMAVVEGIKTYDAGFQDIPVKLKWPNDIYALDPSNTSSASYVKIGGVLVNSHYSEKEYICVIGVGLNTTNASPTTSLNALKPPTPLTLEKLLARILASFSDLYGHFVRNGFDEKLEDAYYKHWLHMDQVVVVKAEGVRARIKGITRDWGLLKAEELGYSERVTGRTITLQSDSNSFDFFNGLIKRKVIA